MDDTAELRYRAGTMRLLLLLSALLTALSGIAGTRVSAQPVQASAAASVASPRVVVAAPVALRLASSTYGNVPPLRLGFRPPVSALVSRILYAERRRE